MVQPPEQRRIFSLSEVTKSIAKTLTARYRSAYWIRTEMNKLNFYRQSGHCYPELVEKKQGRVVAQMKAILWKDDFEPINRKFIEVLKEPLRDGIKILFLAQIGFDPTHGLSLRILDIDPAYTLGDIEREKQETLNKLRTEGLYDRNRSLHLPLLPQRIAIISVETSKGYADFLNILEGNSQQFTFFRMLFPSLLQGEKAVTDIIGQLKRIEKVHQHFDLVAIIRGGGGDIGLSCYDNYKLARAIAVFPLPVMTGIGHATNETVAEMVAHYNAITPTKLAEHLIQYFHQFSRAVQKAREGIAELSVRIVRSETQLFQQETKLFRSATRNLLTISSKQLHATRQDLAQQSLFMCREQTQHLQHKQWQLKRSARVFLDGHNAGLDGTDKNINNLSPKNVLKRGYSITRVNGKAIRDAEALSPGQIISTELLEGTLESQVVQIKTNDNES